jgi:creatinine amidohydrolase
MTEFVPFDQLTWPDVAALPRSMPLVIPLGVGYPMDRLVNALGDPPRVGMLPPIPFGWFGSGLAVPSLILRSLVINLLDSLHDDGFSRVYALCPQGLDLGLPGPWLALPQPANHTPVTSQQLPHEVHKGKVIIIPIGQTEQHGYHLPLSTDTLIIEAISQGIAVAIPEQAITLPVMPYGVSTHRQAFAGTLNCGGRAFEDFWLAVVDTLVQRGFDRFYLMSGHGGNSSFLVNVVKYVGERHPRIFCATAWLYLSGSEGVAALEKYRRSSLGGMGHACELETSLMLHLRPELVHIDKAFDEMDFVTTPNYYMDWVEGGSLIANPSWYDDTRTGAYGAGSLATAENGQIWYEAAITEKITQISEIHTQHAQREARRQSGFGRWGNQ